MQSGMVQKSYLIFTFMHFEGLNNRYKFRIDKHYIHIYKNKK